ncbi:MAG: hypothetical protein H6839_06040 [Planctomycetes bacterium]|nr:hypothetical protein [Planctomycetota bacterium]
MARIESTDGGSFFELTPQHITRGRGATGDEDGVECVVRFESYGEPIIGEPHLTRGGLNRMVEKLKSFTVKRTGMMQLRSDTQEIELSLAAKRSKWTQKINVTGLAGVPKEDRAEPDVPEEVRVSFGATYRQSNALGGSVEHRCGMVCTFDALSAFADALKSEFEAAPTRRGTGKIEPSGA